MNVVVGYESGAKMSYSLNAFMPWEGYTIDFNGVQGPAGAQVPRDGLYQRRWLGARRAAGGRDDHHHLSALWHSLLSARLGRKGGHGGGDVVLLDDLFSPNPPADKYLRAADQRSGAYSMLTGAAANLSMSTGKQVYIADLVQGIGMPDYPPMPTPNDPIPLGDTRSRRVTAHDMRPPHKE